jgi:hypothetical protein
VVGVTWIFFPSNPTALSNHSLWTLFQPGCLYPSRKVGRKCTNLSYYSSSSSLHYFCQLAYPVFEISTEDSLLSIPLLSWLAFSCKPIRHWLSHSSFFSFQFTMYTTGRDMIQKPSVLSLLFLYKIIPYFRSHLFCLAHQMKPLFGFEHLIVKPHPSWLSRLLQAELLPSSIAFVMGGACPKHTGFLPTHPVLSSPWC